MSSNLGDNSCRRFRPCRLWLTGVVFLVASALCFGGEETIGTLRGAPLVGDVLWNDERVEEMPSDYLWARVFPFVYEAEIERLGFDVSEAEVAAANAAQFENLGFTEETATALVERLRATKTALEDWLASPEDEHEIYRNLAAVHGIRESDWESLKRYHGTPEELDKIQIPDGSAGPAAVLKAGIADMRGYLLRKILAERIRGSEIVSSGEDWDAYLAFREIEPNSEKARESQYFFVQEEVTKTLYPWMANLILDGQLVIENKEFNEPLEAQARRIADRADGKSGTNTGKVVSRGDTTEPEPEEVGSPSSPEPVKVSTSPMDARAPDAPITESEVKADEVVDPDVESGNFRVVLAIVVIGATAAMAYALWLRRRGE